MKVVIRKEFQHLSKAIVGIITNFNSSGIYFSEPVRNAIKIFELDSKKVNVKSFKLPNLFNKIVYGYFRKSKAKRSFEFATILLQRNIGTPQPIAYFENSDIIGLKDSYYMSEQMDIDLLFRDLIINDNYPDKENILRQFVQFMFDLHEKNIEFIDNTSGNTLIKKVGENKYDFYLVDLNRMNFDRKMSLKKRMLNMSKLTNKPDIVKVMSDEYAKLSNKTYDEIYNLLAVGSENFQERFKRKRRLKKKLFFWR